MGLFNDIIGIALFGSEPDFEFQVRQPSKQVLEELDRREQRYAEIRTKQLRDAMNPEYHNGQAYQSPEPTRREKRAQLERDVQNLIGLIPGIATLSDAELYGMRDELMAEQRAVGKTWKEPGE